MTTGPGDDRDAPLGEAGASLDGAAREGGAARDGPAAVVPEPAVPLRRELAAWWREGVRTALFRRPRWGRLRTTPTIAFWIVVAPSIFTIAVSRFDVDGDAEFYWPALSAGWMVFVAFAMASWLLVPVPPDRSATPSTDALLDRPGDAATLFTMLAAQWSAIVLVSVTLSSVVNHDVWRLSGPLFEWPGPALICWTIAAQIVLVQRSGRRPRVTRSAIASALAVAVVVGLWTRPYAYWYRNAPPDDEWPGTLALTPAIVETQPALLASRLAALAPERRGLVDLYAITYAPYADDDTFRNESAMVADVMRRRFDAVGRTVELVNHRDTATTLPWATPEALRRTIAAMAAKMNRDEDVLFVHLTSHGARDGRLSTHLEPLTIEPLTPAALVAMLDAAGVRNRVISVSACFSGSWVAPLADADTLVLTAADADHTSYGCGRGSEFTYFGRALYDEELRRTRSFEEAHARARTVIDTRERQAGKSDGYSNPQIAMGTRIRARLDRLAAERAAAER